MSATLLRRPLAPAAPESMAADLGLSLPRRQDPAAAAPGRMPVHDAASERVEDCLRASQQLELPCGVARAHACLSNLGCLPRWWPRARGLLPQPPGLCEVGDLALLQLADGHALLKVLCFQPQRRIVLSIAGPVQSLLLDLRLQQRPVGCRLQLVLESIPPAGRLAHWHAACRLAWLARQAAQGLKRHLQWELTG